MVNGTTQAWSTNMMSHMDGEELYLQTNFASLMHNGKMELHMDTIDSMCKMVTVLNVNIKMASGLEMFEIN